jgi:SulP family sulfate permease
LNPRVKAMLRPLMPPVRAVKNYKKRDLPADLLAGLTVSVVDLPQSMAFALIAGVPPIYGLYTAIFLAFLGALFTSSRFLSVGPTNTQSLLVAAVVTRLTNDPSVYLQLVLGLTFIKGVIQLAFAAARMGRMVRYVSHSVMIGFTAGAGTLIFVEQVPSFLGLDLSGIEHSLPGLLGAIERIAPHIGATDPRALGIGIGALVVILIAPRLSRFIPGPLLAIAASGIVVSVAGWTAGDLRLIGTLPRGLPSPSLPDLSLAQTEALLSGALALALLGMLESVSIAKSIAYRTGQRIDADQEFFGQGFANVIGSFFQCMPGSGSFSRTALQYVVGAKTRFASVFCALFNALIFLALAPLAHDIPLAALAAILLVVAIKLIDVQNIARVMRASRGDGLVCVATYLSALLLPLAYAIYFGIFLNIALYLRRAGRLHLAELVETADGRFMERPFEPNSDDSPEILFLQIDGPLFFAVVDELSDRLGAIAESPTEVVILRLKRVHHVDANALFALERFVETMRGGGDHVILCGVRPELAERMKRFGATERIGEENIYLQSDSLHTGAKKALARARAIVASHEATAAPDEPTEWMYHI